MKVFREVTPCDSLRYIPLLLSDTLNKNVVGFFETSLTKYQVTWPHIPKTSQFHNHRVLNPVFYCNIFGIIVHFELISMFLKLVCKHFFC